LDSSNNFASAGVLMLTAGCACRCREKSRCRSLSPVESKEI